MVLNALKHVFNLQVLYVNCIQFVTVNPRHMCPVFLKFERSFEIYMSVLNIANDISEFLRLISLVY